MKISTTVLKEVIKIIENTIYPEDSNTVVIPVFDNSRPLDYNNEMKVTHFEFKRFDKEFYLTDIYNTRH